MRRLVRAGWTIARRDYVATVLSRTFLLFLVGPLLPLLFGGLFGAIAARDPGTGAPRPLAIAADAATTQALERANRRLAARLGNEWLPPLRTVGPHASPHRLLGADDAPAAVLAGTLGHPILSGSGDAIRHLRGPVELLVEEARRTPGAAQPATVGTRTIERATPATDADRRDLARGAQLVLFVLTMILAGMLISNLVEEKSSKVIEILAAAVPVDAIFAGKLVGMLAVSLTGIAAWGSMAGVAAWAFLPHAAVPDPAVGWPVFVLLAFAYFVSVYLLLGALYLGIGAQAGSVREVQTLSMPLTMAQLLVFGLASATIAQPDGALGMAATIVPWSSPFAMLARAAQTPALWPHPLALVWQFTCLAGVIAVSARLFRRTVLKSGGRPARAQP